MTRFALFQIRDGTDDWSGLGILGLDRENIADLGNVFQKNFQIEQTRGVCLVK